MTELPPPRGDRKTSHRTRSILAVPVAAVAATLALWSGGCGNEQPAAPPSTPGIEVNDIHSQLNATRVAEVVAPRSVAEIQALVKRARAERRSISIAGARHAMGGQQFGEGTILADMTAMNRVLRFDREHGRVEAEAGVTWPELRDYLDDAQRGDGPRWGIRQKQTGADRLTLGGALAANAHGRGLRFKPIVQDVESFVLVTADGKARRCDRAENRELFGLAIGGYGLFGVIASVELRLAPRQRVERVVEVRTIEGLEEAFDRRVADGFLYGDFQYAVDPSAPDFLRKGVFACYRPVPDTTPITERPAELSGAAWAELSYLAHVDPSQAFERYAAYYLSTQGQVYWSDTHQFGEYLEGYHADIDRRLGATQRGTEMITELYVPRGSLEAFMEDVRAWMKAEAFGPIYGTVRLIEQDDETFLAWAAQRSACVIFNLHVDHTPQGIELASARFRRLIDLASAHGGSYFPTYHRWATREQVERCYPQFAEFLARKRKFDPDEIFQSEWYRHYRAMFAR